MLSVAIKMLIGNKASFIGVIFGIFLAILLISQQSAIFLGLVSRSYRIVTAISAPDVWVLDPGTSGEDIIRSMPANYLGYVKSIPDVEWAVPINYALFPMTAPHSGIFKMAEVYGIDDETLIGAPELLEGDIANLHSEGAIIIDSDSAAGILATTSPDGTKIPLKLGDILEINDKRAVIVGIGKPIRGFFPQPNIFTTHSQFQTFSGSDRIQYIGVKTKEGADVNQVLRQINAHSNAVGMTRDDLASRMANHFLKTGILINFGLSVILGLIIGFSIAGQIFYIMTLQNLSYYALIKALGGTEKTILAMILVQSILVGTIGYLLGTGATLLWGYAIKETTLAFEFPWQLLMFTAFLALIMCIFISVLSIKKVFKVDPQILLINI
ncbi:MAG: ABC transporter permease [Parachlamydiaceae bacterium]|nr:ABC transporter permease [Parachlamydiaceae bacterium]